MPVEQGRIGLPKVSRHLRRCTFCATDAVSDERHCVFDCPLFQGLQQHHAEILQDSHDAMRSFVWHKEQKSRQLFVLWRRRRKLVRTSIQPAKAYEDESVMLSAPH